MRHSERLIRSRRKFHNKMKETNIRKYAELMKELGLTMNTSALGVTEDMLEGLADVTIHLTGGYKDLDREEILQIFRESLG